MINTPTPAAIRAAREAAGLTQTQAAQWVLVGLRAWQHWELGERKMPPGLWQLFRLKAWLSELKLLQNFTL